jgi:heptosyltransferase-2
MQMLPWMNEHVNILIIQTAFLGDVILTLPLAQALRRSYPDATIDMMVIPGAAEIVSGSPAIDETILFDKKGNQRGLLALFKLGIELRSRGYDCVITPHRSLRTGVLAYVSQAPRRIGFSASALSIVFTRRIQFAEGLHEADRNLQLLQGLDIIPPAKERPVLQPSVADSAVVDEFLSAAGIESQNLIGVAPGSVWFTKRWPTQKYAQLIRELEGRGHVCVLLGGMEDVPLTESILSSSDARRSVSAAGKMTLLQSAELIGRCSSLVTNDSAPLHIGVAMRTKVVALFGPTVPQFGFTPYGEDDTVIQREGLSCRPCTKHGGNACPIGTFECMEAISPSTVADMATVAGKET